MLKFIWKISLVAIFLSTAITTFAMEASKSSTMIEQHFYFQQSFVSKISMAKETGYGLVSSSKEAKEAYLFLHGFPAESGKNEDLARAVANSTGKDVFIIHYEGLGQSHGQFSFVRTVEMPAEFIRYLLNQENYVRIHLIGHSWGGLVAINLKKMFGEEIGKLVLLAPFVAVPNSTVARILLSEVKDTNPRIADRIDVESLTEEINIIIRSYHPLKIAPQAFAPLNDVFILQGLEDVESTPDNTKQLVASFPSRPTYKEIHQPHSFDDRQLLISIVASWLGKED